MLLRAEAWHPDRAAKSFEMIRHRKLMRRWENPGQARYLTFSCYQRLPLLKNDKIKKLFVDRMAELRREEMFKLFAYVVMPEHAHMLILPNLPRHSVSVIMHRMKRVVAERVIKRWRELDAPILRRLIDAEERLHFWQRGGGYDRNIVGEDELHEKIGYIHDNPVRRGLVTTQVDWLWSSAPWYYGERHGPISIDPL